MLETVNALIIDDNNKLLIVKRNFDSDEPGMWSLPWWTVENWESLKMALIREIKEELSLDISKSDFEIISTISLPNINASYFLIKNTSNLSIILEPSELLDYKFISYYKIPEKMAFWQELIIKNYINSL